MLSPIDRLRDQILRLEPETRRQLLREVERSLSAPHPTPAPPPDAADDLAELNHVPTGTARDLSLAQVLSIGAGWGAGWALVGLALALTLKLTRPGYFGAGETIGQLVGVLSLLGFGAGLAFLGLVGFLEGRRPLRRIPLLRIALWGAIGAA